MTALLRLPEPSNQALACVCLYITWFWQEPGCQFTQNPHPQYLIGRLISLGQMITSLSATVALGGSSYNYSSIQMSPLSAYHQAHPSSGLQSPTVHAALSLAHC